MEKEKKKIYQKWWFWLILIILIIALFGNKDTQQGIQDGFNNATATSTNTTDNQTLRLSHGELQSFTISPDTTKKCCVIKAKIEPSYNNKATIHQNFFNVEDFIKKQGGNSYDEIQYWAVADMKSGEESKVISFTLNKTVIDDLYLNKIAANQLDTYLDDLWILESLKN